MASTISYEYFKSLQNAANGLAMLDSDSKIDMAYLPDCVINSCKGTYADEAALVLAYPTANTGDYAYVTDTASYWYWNAELSTPAWVNQQISEANYLALTQAERDAVPYIIVS